MKPQSLKTRPSCSGKTEYITTMFNKRTEGKNFENFVLNAIYTKIGNLELIPITQKYVKLGRKKEKLDEEWTAKIDLFFPQINYAIEVDEGYHLEEEQRQKDKEREEAIKKLLKCDFERIRCAKKISQTEIRYLEPYEIDKEINKVVEKIAERIKSTRLEWKTNEELLAEIRKTRRLDINSDERFGYHGPLRRHG